MLLVLGAIIGYWLYTERIQVEVRERDRLQTQARVIEANLGRQLESVSKTLVDIRDEFSPPLNKTTAAEASRHLKALSLAMPGAYAITIHDAKGIAVAASRHELLNDDASERAYFKVARAGANPDTLYVAPPFKTVLGTYSILVTRAIRGSEGEFAGSTTAALDPDYFSVLLRSVLYAPDMWTSLAHEDGKVFLFMPPNEQALGADLNRPGSFRNRHLETGQTATVMTGTVYATGEERMMAQQLAKPAGIHLDKTIGIAVSRDLAAIYLPWRRQVLAHGLLYAVIAAAAILGMFFYQRRKMTHDRIEAVYETERNRTEDTLRDAGERLRQLSQRLIDAEDGIRRAITRELHDRVGASLSALNLNLSILRSQLPQESLRVVEARLDDTQKLLEGTTAQVRDLMADLHPPALDDYGLLAALQTYVHDLGARIATPISICGEYIAPRLPLVAETALFRIAQGAIANAVTHARANLIQVRLAESPDRVTLTIADDGIGFSVVHPSLTRASWGLAIQRERAQAVGAELSLESTPGAGTQVRVEIQRERR